ncbi:MAG: hypothetical protein CL543_18035 [Alcanivorax sp.]|nr:LysR family transcriptional regulator [Alcanivorax sp. ZXX171]MBU60744.1 hypothetical protein [Alcanivorax sp.]
MPGWQLQQLIQFRAVYEHGSLSAAARALGVSQPALSRALAPDILIEEELAAGWLVPLPLDVGAATETCAYRLRSRPLSQAAGRLWRLLADGGLRSGEDDLIRPASRSESGTD